MEKISLLPADSYIVVNKTILTDEDKTNLIALYEPIIGPIAISLYLTLWNDLDKLSMASFDLNHHHLMCLMKLDLNSLRSAREALEAVGLIKTLFKKGDINSYIYELYSPLTPKEFLSHPIFNVVLYNNVGKKEYEKIKALYQKVNINTEEYEDISTTINESFISSSVIPEFDARSKEYLAPNAKNIINFDELLASIPKNIINEKAFNKRMRELVNNLAFIYNLDTLKMAEIIRSTLNENGSIVASELRKKTREYYSYSNSGKLPTLIYRTQPDYLKKPLGDTSNRAKMIYVFENTTPYDFLKGRSKGANPTSRDLRLIENLVEDIKLKPAVVNVLIDYVLKKNNNKLSKDYVETIAGQWKRCGIETAEEAMNLAEKEYKKASKNTYKSSQNKKTESKPIWFKEDIKKEDLSKDEEEELEELMKGFQ